jgi:hypothetical protein
MVKYRDIKLCRWIIDLRPSGPTGMKLLKGWFDLWDSVSCDHAVKVRR